MDDATALRLFRTCFPDKISTSKVAVRSRARLWAGMGNIYEVREAKSGSSNNTQTQKKLLVKYVHPRLPKSGNLSMGDQRKLDSYLVEANFYEHYAKCLLEDYPQVPLPAPLYVERDLEDASNPIIIICMGELWPSRPGTSRNHNNETDDIHVSVVKWLAKFHAATWHRSHGNDDNDNKVQAVGSYWHLDTRPSEWQDMPRHGWEGRLKRAAKAIDERLKRDPLQCWVHGDTKDANILYSSSSELAFCDFQYTGRGPPSRDLSYYFCSSHVDDLEEQTSLLDVYYQDLTKYLREKNTMVTDSSETSTTSTSNQQQPHTIPTRQQLDDSMELAYADYCRFMCGWGYWGYDLSAQVKATLEKLDGGKMLQSEDDYQQAVRRVFG